MITNKSAMQRFREHCRNSVNGISNFSDQPYENRPLLSQLGKAIREYGKENVIVKTLVIANDMEFLKELEVKAIKRYQTLFSYSGHRTGYNMRRGNCPKEIDWIVKIKKWRVTLTPSFDWPPNYFKKKAIYISDFNTLGEARKVYLEIITEEDRIWHSTIYAECLKDPNCYDGYYKKYMINGRFFYVKFPGSYKE